MKLPKPFEKFGSISNIAVGTIFENRRELANSGIHRPLQAGICGTERLGAESIVISGGYEDDEDMGDRIIYTGAGGVEPKTGRQIGNQTLTRTNLALSRNCQNSFPVRVIRGSRGDRNYSPPYGFRYDGLYQVLKFWPEVGRSGFTVYRFELVSYDSLYGNIFNKISKQYVPVSESDLARIRAMVEGKEFQ